MPKNNIKNKTPLVSEYVTPIDHPLIHTPSPTPPSHRRKQPFRNTTRPMGLPGDAGGRPAVSLRTITVMAENPVTKHKMIINAILAESSAVTALSPDVVRGLGLPTRGHPCKTFDLEGFGGQTSERKAELCTLNLRSLSGGSLLGGSEAFSVDAVVMPSPAGDLRPVDWSTLKSKFQHLAEVSVAPPAAGGVHLLVGAPNRVLHRVIRELHSDHPMEPDARLSSLGWTIIGPYEVQEDDDDESLDSFRASFEVKLFDK